MSDVKTLIGSFYKEPDGRVTSSIDNTIEFSDIKQMMESLKLMIRLHKNHVIHDTKGLNWIKCHFLHYLLVTKEVEKKDDAF